MTLSHHCRLGLQQCDASCIHGPIRLCSLLGEWCDISLRLSEVVFLSPKQHFHRLPLCVDLVAANICGTYVLNQG